MALPRPKEEKSINLNDLLKEQNLLRENPFSQKYNVDVALASQWAYRYFYSRPYPGRQLRQGPIQRYHFGMQHATRMALYIPILMNLYNHHGNIDVTRLSPEDIALLQITALFNDLTTTNHETDQRKENAILLYCFLTKNLKIEKDKAKEFAEALLNREDRKEGFLELTETSEGQFTFEYTFKPRNLIQSLLHDTRYLDRLNDDPRFDGTQLDFYKQFGKQKEARDDLERLILETRRFVEIQGDGLGRKRDLIKGRYEKPDAYAKMQDAMKAATPFMTTHFNREIPEAKKESSQQKNYQPGKFSLAQLEAALQHHEVLIQGISFPEKKEEEKKDVVPHADIPILGGFATPVTSGFGIVIVDFNTPTLVDEQKLNGIKRKKALGQSTDDEEKALFGHHEFTKNPDKCAIYFSDDPTTAGVYPYNPQARFLQAYYFQLHYQKNTGILLPIVKFSNLFHQVEKAPSVDEKSIVAQWTIMCRAFMNRLLQEEGLHPDQLRLIPLEEIKKGSLYGHFDSLTLRSNANQPTDDIYPEALKKEINSALLSTREECIEQDYRFTEQAIEAKQLSFQKKEGWDALFKYPELIPSAREKLISDLSPLLNPPNNPGFTKLISEALGSDRFLTSNLVHLYGIVLKADSGVLKKCFEENIKNYINKKIESLSRSINDAKNFSSIFKKIIIASLFFGLYGDHQHDLNKYLKEALATLKKPENILVLFKLTKFLKKQGILNSKIENEIYKIVSVLPNDNPVRNKFIDLFKIEHNPKEALYTKAKEFIKEGAKPSPALKSPRSLLSMFRREEKQPAVERMNLALTDIQVELGKLQIKYMGQKKAKEYIEQFFKKIDEFKPKLTNEKTLSAQFSDFENFIVTALEKLKEKDESLHKDISHAFSKLIDLSKELNPPSPR